MIALPETSSPPEEVVKENNAVTLVNAAIRSLKEIKKKGTVNWPPTNPDTIAAENTTSALLVMKMPEILLVATPTQQR